MTLHFIKDSSGNTTGVFIPIEEWELLKTKYVDLQDDEAENELTLATWQKQIIEERLIEYKLNPSIVDDFDKTIDDIEASI